ncbi:MAG: hypothetical protein J6S85_04280 [Methanobrevibacter sp.]|nr:hypothetical protein [Methanobrevibacter sp.]
MDKITKEMLHIYKPFSQLDWMNYKLVRSQITFHHIEKKEEGGKRELSNGALLMPTPHQYLHLIECKDIKTYIALNKVFKIINSQLSEPNKDQREIIEYLLQDFEYKHRNDKNSKGKTLIKKEYKRRW